MVFEYPIFEKQLVFPENVLINSVIEWMQVTHLTMMVKCIVGCFINQWFVHYINCQVKWLTNYAPKIRYLFMLKLIIFIPICEKNIAIFCLNPITWSFFSIQCCNSKVFQKLKIWFISTRWTELIDLAFNRAIYTVVLNLVSSVQYHQIKVIYDNLPLKMLLIGYYGVDYFL